MTAFTATYSDGNTELVFAYTLGQACEMGYNAAEDMDVELVDVQAV